MTSDRLATIVNFVEITDDLGTGGQPTSAQFSLVSAAGYRVVINLGMSDAQLAVAEEDALVTGLGMVYVHLAIPWEAPTRAHAHLFFDLMRSFEGQKVFVHCIKNMRVSALVFAYQVCHQAVSISDAGASLHQVWRPHGIWRNLLIELLAEHGFVYPW